MWNALALGKPVESACLGHMAKFRAIAETTGDVSVSPVDPPSVEISASPSSLTMMNASVDDSDSADILWTREVRVIAVDCQYHLARPVPIVKLARTFSGMPFANVVQNLIALCKPALKPLDGHDLEQKAEKGGDIDPAMPSTDENRRSLLLLLKPESKNVFVNLLRFYLPPYLSPQMSKQLGLTDILHDLVEDFSS